MAIELAEKPKRPYRRKSEEERKPCFVIALLSNGKTLKIEGYQVFDQTGFLKIVTGYNMEERLNLSLCAHVKISGIVPVVAAAPSIGTVASVVSGPVTMPRALDARPPELIPKARPLPTGPSRPQPASVIENADGTQEVTNAVMMPG